ncbi:MAG: transcription antitermination factor NusB [Marmoricola sp.]
MSARSKARKRALDLIFAAEAQGLSAAALLEAGEAPANEYTAELVRGVQDKRDELDSLISANAEGWSLERMPAVDRNVLRLATYEILFVEDVPNAVAISEALHLVRDLSTDESPAFVNGVLASVARGR